MSNLFVISLENIAIFGIFKGIFLQFCDFSFSVAKISAFWAIPKVTIPGSYTSRVIKLHEIKKYGKFSFLANIRVPENGVFGNFVKIAVIFFCVNCRKIAIKIF